MPTCGFNMPSRTGPTIVKVHKWACLTRRDDVSKDARVDTHKA